MPFDADALEVRGDAGRFVEGVQTKAEGAAIVALAADGTLVYANALHAVDRHLVWMERGGARTVLPAPARGYVLARISPDGTRIAVDVRDQAQSVYIWNIARGGLDKLTDSSASDGYPVWTPDSAQIVFGSTRLGRRSVFVQRADGGLARHLFEAGTDTPTGVTADGSRVLFTREGGQDPGEWRGGYQAAADARPELRRRAEAPRAPLARTSGPRRILQTQSAKGRTNRPDLDHSKRLPICGLMVR